MMQLVHCRFGTFTFVSLLTLVGAACGSNDGSSTTPAPAPEVGAGGTGGAAPPTEAAAGQAGTPEPTQTPGEDPGTPPLDMQEGLPGEPLGPNGTVNLFTELLGIPDDQVTEKITLAANRIFGIGTGESAIPVVDAGYRVYYELPQNPEQAFIWAADSSDIRSEGMSYGMMIAVQLDMRQQFDRLWNFAKAYMQFPADSELSAWRHYFRWQGSVNTTDPSNWQVVYDPQTGPAPDGDEYFAAALFLADRRWGSDGAVNYLEEASTISAALLNNQSSDASRTAIINPTSNMVVFYPQGNSASFSDPSYHLPAFYELFAEDGPEADAARWRQVAETSRQFFVTSAHPDTGLHPDYANFDGTPNAGGDLHDQFRYDAWRVVMNMAVDYAWGSRDERLKTQIEKYHTFFSTRLGTGNVTAALFALDGSNPSGGGSTALTATLATGTLVSESDSRTQFVQNLWDVQQQQGTFRYYQETVYMLGLLTTAGRYAVAFGDTPE
jgi:oligosaccharide reducing-end xylanase